MSESTPKLTLKYSEGWALGSEERNKLLEEVYAELLKDPDPNAYVDVSTGDAFIFVAKHLDSQGHVTIVVVDATVRREAILCLPPGVPIPDRIDIKNG